MTNASDFSIPRFAPAWDLGDAMRKSLRGLGSVNLQAIAQQLGVSRNTVGNWLSGRSQPDDRTLAEWARVTGVPLRWLTSFRADLDPYRVRFTAQEMVTIGEAAASRGETVRTYLRRFATAVMSEDELALLPPSTLMEMWFHNHRVYVAQREDEAPGDAADATSLSDPEMSRRLEKSLNNRGIYPEMERIRREDELRQFDSPDL